jgi:electron transfer flavoprotein alpha subunit
MSTQWVIAETAALAAELIGAARSLASGTLSAFVGGDEAAARGLIAYGAESTFALPLEAGAMWEDYADPLAERARTEHPSLILIGATKRGRGLAALLAAKLDAPCITDGTKIKVDEGRVTAERMVLGGLAMKVVSTDAGTVVITIGRGVYAALPADAGRSGSVSSLVAGPGPVRVTGRRLKESSHVDLNAATRVVGVGRGFDTQADLVLAENLAKAMGAEMACSRPIADFFQWMPEETYIGISGQVIKPDIYVAVGISGQAQHVFGVRDAKVIVGINKDENAPIHQVADYSIVGDIKAVLPILTEAFSKASRG